MSYIEHPCANPQNEIPSVLRRDDVTLIDLDKVESNRRAISEVRDYVTLCSGQSTQVVMSDIVRDRYGNRPYGWNEWETVLILAKLYVAGEIIFVFNGGDVERQRVSEIITKLSNWNKITIRQRKAPDPMKLESARKIGQVLFGEMGPDKEEPLTDFLKGHFQIWCGKLNQYKTLAGTGNYPGSAIINDGLRLCAIMLDAKDNYTFINRMNENKDELSEFAEEYHDIDTFYSTQQPTWEKLRNAKSRFDINNSLLDSRESLLSHTLFVSDSLNHVYIQLMLDSF